VLAISGHNQAKVSKFLKYSMMVLSNGNDEPTQESQFLAFLLLLKGLIIAIFDRLLVWLYYGKKHDLSNKKNPSVTRHRRGGT
jgi:hypothetical protein